MASKKNSTSNKLKSMIARALDEDEHLLMVSIDLSSTFDVVNIGLLLQRLRVAGLPLDLVDLIEVWLRNRLFYVEANGQTSNCFESNFGTIQGSILGPIVYAIFVPSLFVITNFTILPTIIFH